MSGFFYEFEDVDAARAAMPQAFQGDSEAPGYAFMLAILKTPPGLSRGPDDAGNNETIVQAPGQRSLGFVILSAADDGPAEAAFVPAHHGGFA